MTKLFGVDIQAEIAKGFKGQLLPLTLIRLAAGTPTLGSLTSGTNDVETLHAGEGFVEGTSDKAPGTLVKGATAVVSIIGGSLPVGIEPAASDRVVIDGGEYELLKVDTDPAKALFECQAVI